MKFLSIYVIAVSLIAVVTSSKHLITLTEENWQDILKGEWLLEFYAPWCPACKDLNKAWKAVAEWSKTESVKVADVDVTKNPGLSGRFLVTALPTIYHVKDGVFRHYSGPRDKEDFISFIEEKKWSTLEPIHWLRHPASKQMAVVATFFKASMSVRDAHNYFVEKKGLPVWGSYAIFAGATLFLGCILGFIIVCLIDVVFPSGAKAMGDAKKDKGGKKKATGKKEKVHDTHSGSDDDDVRQRKGAKGDRSANGGSSPKNKK
jgi:thiol-disulfide isomerase/thioredoxin